MSGWRYSGLLVFIVSAASYAQVCRISVAGLNRERRVTGQIHVECPEEIVHSAPFGNWGVTSPFGSKGNSHQFDGWCHNTRVCDNAGACATDCTDGWYEWNSCTDHALFRPPNCTLFNAAECTEQATVTGINVHGTKYVDVPVSCPTDTNGDGIADQGGCADVKQYASGTNFMSLYELDPICCDELVQTVYFPPVTAPLTCDAFGCGANASEWVSPSSWDSPATPAKVFAQMAMVVNWGGFVDRNSACRLSAPAFSVVSAASFNGPNTAPESIASAFGSQLSPVTAEGATIPLPMSLAGVSVRITDRNGTERASPLFYISPGQVNFLVPSNTATGAATVSIYSGEVRRSSGRIQVETVAPALFTANANGMGVPSALVQRNGSWTPVFTCNMGCSPAPVDLGSGGENAYLILFGTGIRHRSALTAVSVVIGGLNARVEYAGPQSQYEGLDQVNVLLPRELAGRGLVDVALTVDGKPANAVQIAIR